MDHLYAKMSGEQGMNGRSTAHRHSTRCGYGNDARLWNNWKTSDRPCSAYRLAIGLALASTSKNIQSRYGRL